MLSVRLGCALALSLAAACDDAHLVLAADSGVTTPLDGGIDGGVAPRPGCVDDPDNPPDLLECTGLYADFAQKLVAPGVREFSPAVPLWSDNAEKRRWIWLPPGTVIDNTRSNSWSFPVGTKAWKEFKHDGQRMETRLFMKVRADRWLWATYVWRDGESRTERSFGETIPVRDGTYVVPLDKDCAVCHEGRRDRLLGFEEVLLGLPGAAGVTLAGLAAEGRLSRPPARIELQIPDDGSGAAAGALGWLHVNCGVSCHNDEPDSTGYPSGLFMRLDADQMVSLPLSQWNAVRTTVNVRAQGANFVGETRIVPGDPGRSLLARLASERGTRLQMPPIASRIVDPVGRMQLETWIARMPALGDGGSGAPPSALDAGAPDPAPAPAVPGPAMTAPPAALPSPEPAPLGGSEGAPPAPP